MAFSTVGGSTPLAPRFRARTSSSYRGRRQTPTLNQLAGLPAFSKAHANDPADIQVRVELPAGGTINRSPAYALPELASKPAPKGVGSSFFEKMNGGSDALFTLNLSPFRYRPEGE